MGMDKSYGLAGAPAARQPQTMPPAQAGADLLEDDDDGVTGVVNVAHQNAEHVGKSVDAQQQKLTEQMQKFQRRLLDSGPINLGKHRPHSKR